jgi:signal transduction histidine kinase
MRLQSVHRLAEEEEGLGLIDQVDSLQLFDEILRSGQPMLFGDSQVEAGLQNTETREITREISWLGIPLLAKGEPNGIIALEKREPDFYTSDQIQVAAAFAGQAAIAMENARLYEETRRLSNELDARVRLRTQELTEANRETQALLHILTELSASLDMDQVLDRTLAVLNEASGAQESAIWLVRNGASGAEAEAGSLQAFHRLSGEIGGIRDPKISPPPAFEQALAKFVVQSRKPVVLPTVPPEAVDPAGVPAGEPAGEPAGVPNGEPAITEAGPFHSLAAVPLILGEDVLGSLQLYHTQPGFFSDGLLNLVQAAARQMSITIHNAGLYGLIRDQAEHLGGMLRQQQIEASRSRAILEAVGDGVLVTDNENRITLLNASASGILGLPAPQTLGEGVDRMVGWAGPGVQEWVGAIQAWSSDPGRCRPGDSYHDQVTLSNGRIAGIHLAPVIWRAGFLGTVTIFRDITREITADRLKSDFITNISHELRTPLMSLQGYVELLLVGAGGALTDSQRQHLEVIQHNTGRLSVLVEDLLDISRIETGRLALSQEPVDLAGVAGRVIQDLQRQAREENKSIRFQLAAAGHEAVVVADSERMVQIFENLLGNAYRYTPSGGSVEVRIQPSETEVQVEVQDTGIGIPLAEQGRIFERFYRGEHPLVQAVPGAGLGLSIVKALVEMHQGRVWASSSGKEGEGSTFGFSLPRSLSGSSG